MSVPLIRPYPVGDREGQRIEALQALEILDTDFEPAFDHLVAIARDVFHVPIVLVSLVDTDRQWFKACHGLEIRETPRELAFCNYTVLGSDLFVVEDAEQDERFRHNPFVTGEAGIRFYAGCPLDMGEGLMAGSICIVDNRPRTLSRKQKEALRSLGTIASSLLHQHRMTLQTTKLAQELAVKSQLVDLQAKHLEAQKRILTAASELAKVGAWERNLLTGRLIWSEGMYDLHEVDASFAPTFDNMRPFYLPQDYERLTEVIRQSEANNTSYTFECRMITARGKERWIRILGDVETVEGRAVRRFGMKQDITEEKERLEQIRRLAETDSLTGLSNRTLLVEKLDSLKSKQRRFWLLLLDLDGFKEINDIHGHPAGDYCLKAVGQRLKDLLGYDHFISRISGDEFAIVVERSRTRSQLVELANSVLAAVGRPIIYGSSELSFTVSIGVAQSEGETATTADTMKEADLALYRAKADGRDCFAFFSAEMRDAAEKKARVLSQIRDALRNKEMQLYYQGKVDLTTRQIVGYEALLRWSSRTGIRSPGEFREALDDIRLSAEIGRFVIGAALDQAAEWKATGYAFGSIAINIGPSQFRDEHFAEDVIDQIHERGLDPASIEIEVTEDVFLSRGPNIVLQNVERLRQAGVRIALDDFGTGFASLSHLLTYSVSTIKIDRSFVSGLSSKAGGAGLVKAIVDIGRSLAVQVVAEGIETEAQAEFLRTVGCTLGQGYLFHKPAPSSEIEQAVGIKGGVAGSWP
jgi:diguanylate cyclase (GGDEF)-like protein